MKHCDNGTHHGCAQTEIGNDQPGRVGIIPLMRRIIGSLNKSCEARHTAAQHDQFRVKGNRKLAIAIAR